MGQPLDKSLVSELGRVRIRRGYIILEGSGQALAGATVRWLASLLAVDR